ncbi:MAG: hypothetical protein QOF18_1206 [Frankiaceae bacterium]|nr:hypothetical protein [Frankiaceae bacterium]
MSEVRRRRGNVIVSLTAEEGAVLTSLAGQVALLLTDADAPSDADADADPLEAIVGLSGGPAAAPDDPALRRLLPDAYADDASAGEFRRLMDNELRGLKSDALNRLIADVRGAAGDGKPVSLKDADVEVWLQAINDVRLTLGTRLDVTEDMAEAWSDLDPADPRATLLLAYDWLGWLQESLVGALDD